MTIVIARPELRAIAATTYGWVEALRGDTAQLGHLADAPTQVDQSLARISQQATDISWGTPPSTSAQLGGLVDAINAVAVHAGSVDPSSGSTKPRDLANALRAATHAHGQVQTAMMERGWHPTGHEYIWPT